MKPKTLFIVLGILILLLLVVRGCMSYVKKEVGKAVDGILTAERAKFLEGTDLSTAAYAIILDDQNPPILIDDKAVLEANKDSIEVDISWMSYLPGEGPSPKGIWLFKDNVLVKNKIARKFKTFEMGSLRQHGKPLRFNAIYDYRESYLKQKDSLEKNNRVYITRASEVDADGYEYRFNLHCPAILVSEQDTIFDHHAYGKEFANNIIASLSGLKGFKAGENTANSMETGPALIMTSKDATHYLRNSENKATITLDGYLLYGQQLHFRCTKDFYEQVKAHDFTPAFVRAGLSKKQIKRLIQEKLGPSNQKDKVDAVFEAMFPTDFWLGELFGQKYEMRYYEVVDSLATANLKLHPK